MKRCHDVSVMGTFCMLGRFPVSYDGSACPKGPCSSFRQKITPQGGQGGLEKGSEVNAPLSSPKFFSSLSPVSNATGLHPMPKERAPPRPMSKIGI